MNIDVDSVPHTDVKEILLNQHHNILSYSGMNH